MSVLKPASPSSVLSNAAFALRPSACPGLLRVVAALDGGICRIKLPGGALSATQATCIAEASERHAAGVIEVTNRANLQVRGVRAGHEAALIAALLDAGLGPTAPGALSAAAADDVRNLMVSPVAGRDPFALIDTMPLARELLALLQSEARFVALSPKFALLLDGGERLARVDHPHDIWLAATKTEHGVQFSLGLAGCPPTTAAPATATAESAVLRIPPAQVIAAIRALLHTFLDLAATDATRMRHLLAVSSVDAVLHHASHHAGFTLARDPALA
ncbi:MAG TPA: oxidoreductase, partial [Paraburkholderia sp.]|nr:oxidoreductase [Paraburkholderia sp.]